MVAFAPLPDVEKCQVRIEFAEQLKRNPTPAEREFTRILNTVEGGKLRKLLHMSTTRWAQVDSGCFLFRAVFG
jgi:hypothetical protein